MTVENTKLFFAQLEQNPALSKQLADHNAQSLIQLGRETGLDFDENDLRQLIRETSADDSELSEEELEVVAGGVFPEIDLFRWVADQF